MIKNRKKECTRHRHAYVCVYVDAYTRVIGCDCVYSCVCARERESYRESERIHTCMYVCLHTNKYPVAEGVCTGKAVLPAPTDLWLSIDPPRHPCPQPAIHEGVGASFQDSSRENGFPIRSDSHYHPREASTPGKQQPVQWSICECWRALGGWGRAHPEAGAGRR